MMSDSILWAIIFLALAVAGATFVLACAVALTIRTVTRLFRPVR